MLRAALTEWPKNCGLNIGASAGKHDSLDNTGFGSGVTRQ